MVFAGLLTVTHTHHSVSRTLQIIWFTKRIRLDERESRDADTPNIPINYRPTRIH
jgi:hypothetical protein